MTSANQKPFVFGLGTIVVDHQVFLESFPFPDTKGEILEDRYQVGGPVPTALALLSKWAYLTAFQGIWGKDVYGEMIERDLESSGISFESPAPVAGVKSGFAHVWVEQKTGRRTVACHRGNSSIDSETRFQVWIQRTN